MLLLLIWAFCIISILFLGLYVFLIVWFSFFFKFFPSLYNLFPFSKCLYYFVPLLDSLGLYLWKPFLKFFSCLAFGARLWVRALKPDWSCCTSWGICAPNCTTHWPMWTIHWGITSVSAFDILLWVDQIPQKSIFQFLSRGEGSGSQYPENQLRGEVGIFAFIIRCVPDHLSPRCQHGTYTLNYEYYSPAHNPIFPL